MNTMRNDNNVIYALVILFVVYKVFGVMGVDNTLGKILIIKNKNHIKK
jgi:hypothetical protein